MSDTTVNRVAALVAERLAAADPLKKVIAKAESLREFCDKIIKAARDEKQTLINTWAKTSQVSDKAKLLSRALVAASTKRSGPPQLRWAMSDDTTIATRVAGRFVGADDDAKEKKLRKELEKHSKGAGKVLEVQLQGNKWRAIFNTEYAALKVHYKYLGTPGLRLSKASNPSGWSVSTM